MRAADADRDRVVECLNMAYSEGRLSKDEYDGRLENALSARTYADLDLLVTDLPAVQATAMTPVEKTNELAIASLACGLAQFMSGPVLAIPAIVFGHVARRQIKRTGEQGADLALAGVILGWAALILTIVLIVGLAMSVGVTAPCTCTEQPRASGIVGALLNDLKVRPVTHRSPSAIRTFRPRSSSIPRLSSRTRRSRDGTGHNDLPLVADGPDWRSSRCELVAPGCGFAVRAPA